MEQGDVRKPVGRGPVLHSEGLEPQVPSLVRSRERQEAVC